MLRAVVAFGVVGGGIRGPGYRPPVRPISMGPYLLVLAAWHRSSAPGVVDCHEVALVQWHHYLADTIWQMAACW